MEPPAIQPVVGRHFPHGCLYQMAPLFLGGVKMERQVQLSTESAIRSRAAVDQIRMLLTDLNHTVQILDADMRLRTIRADDLVLYHARRHNLMVTIGCLENHLASIERMRSRGNGGQANPTLAHAHAAQQLH
jgi:hypothetical protein